MKKVSSLRLHNITTQSSQTNYSEQLSNMKIKIICPQTYRNIRRNRNNVKYNAPAGYIAQKRQEKHKGAGERATDALIAAFEMARK